MDGCHCFKVREGSKVNNKTLFLTLGPNRKGQKKDLGMRHGKYKSSSFWMNILTALKTCIVEDRDVFPEIPNTNIHNPSN
ncbi:transposase [Flavobacterium sp. 83]|uniref:transposase n=1 Tax=Flavobacterium sp. 83 TaxID=1131812 RepID=UPI00069053BE|nr:transposase [Flavobacterium sp. 83]